MKAQPTETVILVHGLAAHKLVMWPLARYLAGQGFHVVNWGYPSITRGIDTHARRLAELLDQHEQESAGGGYHLVTHSMGSIIARTAIHQLAPDSNCHISAGADELPESTMRGFPPWPTPPTHSIASSLSRLKYLVMLGPPNHGSPVARTLAPFLGWFCLPLHELADDPASYVNQLGCPPRGRWGIVAAERDFVVPLDSTCLADQADHIVVPGLHSGMLFSKQTALEVTHFLRHGQFRPEAKRLYPGIRARSTTGDATRPLCTSP